MDSFERILEALKKEAGKRPQLSETIGLYAKLVEAQAAAVVGEDASPLERNEALAHLGSGEPLLSPETLEIDVKAFADLCSRVGFTLAQCRREFVKPLARIHAWLRDHADEMGRLAMDYMREGHVRRGEEAGLESDLLSFVFNNSLRPFLRPRAEEYSEVISDSLWYRNRCEGVFSARAAISSGATSGSPVRSVVTRTLPNLATIRAKIGSTGWASANAVTAISRRLICARLKGSGCCRSSEC
jgi:hypothetical protein